jgi:hypothetical protein
MIKTKSIQWVVFVTAVLVVFALAVAGLLGVLSVLMPVLGAAVSLLLIIIVSWGVGVLIAYSVIQAAGWLAERGWFV